MIEQGTKAAIYNLGSENSLFVAVPNSVAYVASKHAVLGLSESVLVSLSAVCSGSVMVGSVMVRMTSGQHRRLSSLEGSVCGRSQVFRDREPSRGPSPARARPRRRTLPPTAPARAAAPPGTAPRSSAPSPSHLRASRRRLQRRRRARSLM